ncbi:MAG: MazG nucleotide pyrophosphohydrolase domain-containing protein [Candidatus Paceibacterota bacterium]|nr:RS21-C6 protein [Candidatus Paceibacterota bacterium]
MITLKKDPTLADLQAHVKSICAERGWDKNSHLVILSGLVEELGELTRAMRDYRGEWEQGGKDSKKGEKHHLEGEFADVLNYLLDLSNYFDVDLEKAFREKWKINENRKWGEGGTY